jgi:hypothetical protein
VEKSPCALSHPVQGRARAGSLRSRRVRGALDSVTKFIAGIKGISPRTAFREGR